MLFQDFTDTLLERTLLPFIPKRISPNQVSWLRIFSLPFIYYCLVTGRYTVGFALFLIAALTDALDGAMARKRDRVTETGKVLDAVADRGLIATVAIVFIPPLFGWTLLALLAALELLNAGMAYRSKKILGHNPGANGAGKIKMVLQCIAFCPLFATFAGAPSSLLSYAYDLLLLSLLFTALQAFLYPMSSSIVDNV